MIRRRVAGAVAGALLLAGCGLSQDVTGDGAGAGPPRGSAAPGLTGTQVDGSRFDLAAQHGRPVVIDFFASWCGPCVAQQPALNAVARRYAGRVVFLGIDDREAAAQARSFLSSDQVPYSAIVDADGHIFGDFAVLAPPTTVIVDSRGQVSAGFAGGVTEARLSSTLDSLLGAATATPTAR